MVRTKSRPSPAKASTRLPSTSPFHTAAPVRAWAAALMGMPATGVKVVAGGEHAHRHQKHGRRAPASTLTLARERSRAARHTANTARLTAG